MKITQTCHDVTLFLLDFVQLYNYYSTVLVTYKQLKQHIMHLWLILLFVTVLSASDNNTTFSNDHLLIEHSVTKESAENAIQHLVPDLSKINDN